MNSFLLSLVTLGALSASPLPSAQNCCLPQAACCQTQSDCCQPDAACCQADADCCQPGSACCEADADQSQAQNDKTRAIVRGGI